MMTSYVKAIVLLLTLGLNACAPWRTVAPPYPGTFRPAQPVQVWHDGRSTVLHGVTVDVAAVRGVLFFKPLSCDSCRLTFPLVHVDSLKVGHEGDDLLMPVVVVFAGFFLWRLIDDYVCDDGENCT